MTNSWTNRCEMVVVSAVYFPPALDLSLSANLLPLLPSSRSSSLDLGHTKPRNHKQIKLQRHPRTYRQVKLWSQPPSLLVLHCPIPLNVIVDVPSAVRVVVASSVSATVTQASLGQLVLNVRRRIKLARGFSIARMSRPVCCLIRMMRQSIGRQRIRTSCQSVLTRHGPVS